jgi:hypothetical protein
VNLQPSTASSPRAVASPTLDSPIRKIDFRNFTYPIPDERRGKIRLRNGEQPPTQFSKYGIPYDVGYTLGDIDYGDVTGDGVEEAIIDLGWLSSGTAITSYIYIYTLNHGRPQLLWSFTTGDRADGGLQKVYADNGELVVELEGRNKIIGTDLYASDGHEGGDCCPDSFTRTRYEWRNGRFRQKGKAEVLPLARAAS